MRMIIIWIICQASAVTRSQQHWTPVGDFGLTYRHCSQPPSSKHQIKDHWALKLWWRHKVAQHLTQILYNGLTFSSSPVLYPDFYCVHDTSLKNQHWNPQTVDQYTQYISTIVVWHVPSLASGYIKLAIRKSCGSSTTKLFDHQTILQCVKGWWGKCYAVTHIKLNSCCRLLNKLSL